MTEELDLSRRRWLKGGLVPLRPTNCLPWSVDWFGFTAGCTRCGDCLRACPEQIIVPGDGGYPIIRFSRGECSFCGNCVDSCGQDIFFDKQQSPWRQLASFGDACLAKQGIYCRSCQDVCNAAAIKFKPRPGGISRPELIGDLCTGCGACVAPCPVQTIAVLCQE
ncbi:ferredoxin-type protein NapF [Zobellella aerophila]|uniref:Ferredoxin-type protein NapF n=1 Tax=Zobellella aerophila TaxID=870480 RepID=A0ABP6VDF2_9GAMM